MKPALAFSLLSRRSQVRFLTGVPQYINGLSNSSPL